MRGPKDTVPKGWVRWVEFGDSSIDLILCCEQTGIEMRRKIEPNIMFGPFSFKPVIKIGIVEPTGFCVILQVPGGPYLH